MKSSLKLLKWYVINSYLYNFYLEKQILYRGAGDQNYNIIRQTLQPCMKGYLVLFIFICKIVSWDGVFDKKTTKYPLSKTFKNEMLKKGVN